MTALSIINMRQSQRYHDELVSEKESFSDRWTNAVNELEEILSQDEFDNFWDSTPYDMPKRDFLPIMEAKIKSWHKTADALHKLMVTCDTDPAHIARAEDVQYLAEDADKWQIEAEAQATDYADLKATEANARY